MSISYQEGSITSNEYFDLNCENLNTDPYVSTFVDDIRIILSKYNLPNADEIIKSLCMYKLVIPVEFVNSYQNKKIMSDTIANISKLFNGNKKLTGSVMQKIYERAQIRYSEYLSKYNNTYPPEYFNY